MYGWLPYRAVLAGVVDGDDRRVVQRGGGLRLPAEPGLEGRVARQVGAQHLDRDLPAEPDVAAAVHLGHAAVAERLADLVAGSQQAWRRHLTLSRPSSMVPSVGPPANGRTREVCLPSWPVARPVTRRGRTAARSAPRPRPGPAAGRPRSAAASAGSCAAAPPRRRGTARRAGPGGPADRAGSATAAGRGSPRRPVRPERTPARPALAGRQWCRSRPPLRPVERQWERPPAGRRRADPLAPWGPTRPAPPERARPGRRRRARPRAAGTASPGWSRRSRPAAGAPARRSPSYRPSCTARTASASSPPVPNRDRGSFASVRSTSDRTGAGTSGGSGGGASRICIIATATGESRDERQPPGEALVRHHAQRVDVRGRPDQPALGLLRARSTAPCRPPSRSG